MEVHYNGSVTLTEDEQRIHDFYIRRRDEGDSHSEAIGKMSMSNDLSGIDFRLSLWNRQFLKWLLTYEPGE